jgi:hypothetical protein
MSVLVPGIQTNPASLICPRVGAAIYLTTDASGIGTADVNYPNPANLQPGLYAVLVRNTSNGIGVNAMAYWNGTNWTAGGLAQNNGATLSIFSAAPFTQLASNNTSGGVIAAGIQLVPLSIGKIQGM